MPNLINLDKLAAIFRAHSRLSGSMAGNLETWLGDPGTLPRYQELVPLPLAGERRLLEIGCYQPSVGYYFHLGWREVTGVFKEEGEGTSAESYDGPDGAVARFVKSDVETEKIPVPDGWADVVVMMEVFEHFALDPMHALMEANRVLKPGGRLVFSTPNAASLNLLKKILRGSAPLSGFEFTGYTTNRHNRLYDAIELPGYLEKAGFTVQECFSRSYGHALRGTREKLFGLCVGLWDKLGTLLAPTKRERQRGHFLFVRAVKRGPPVERYPGGLYFSEQEWPGMAAQRARFLRKDGAPG